MHLYRISTSKSLFNALKINLPSYGVSFALDSQLSKTSKISASFPSVHGSKFGRSIAKYTKKNDPGLVQTLSTVNSRVIRTVFNLALRLETKLPDLTDHEGTNCIRKLGKCLNILDFEFNYSSFWLLDILSKMVKDLQIKNVSVKDQITCLAWFSFVLRCISVSGGSREEMFQFLEDVFKKTVNIINEGKPIPKPEDVRSGESTISHKLLSDSKSLLSSKSLTGSESSKRKKRKSSNMSQKSSKKPSVTSSKSRKTVTKSSSGTSTLLISPEEKVNMNLDTFYTFIKMIYKVFADRFVYSVVSGVYSSPVIVTPVDMHIDFHNPKPPKPEPVSPPPEKDMSLKKRKASTAKSSKKEGGSKKKESKKPRSSSKVPIPEGPSEETDKRKQKKSKGNKEIKIDEKPTKEKGEEKSKTKKTNQTQKDKDGTKELSEGKKAGKGKKFSRKSRKSSSIHDEQDIQRIMLEARIKQFDRAISPEKELEVEKLNTKDNFILPLADAVSENFVENLIRRLIPPEEIPVEEPKLTDGKGKKKSVAKEGKKKQKDKK